MAHMTPEALAFDQAKQEALLDAVQDDIIIDAAEIACTWGENCGHCDACVAYGEVG